jgi:hypothetical protein
MKKKKKKKKRRGGGRRRSTRTCSKPRRSETCFLLSNSSERHLVKEWVVQMFKIKVKR